MLLVESSVARRTDGRTDRWVLVECCLTSHMTSRRNEERSGLKVNNEPLIARKKEERERKRERERSLRRHVREAGAAGGSVPHVNRGFLRCKMAAPRV